MPIPVVLILGMHRSGTSVLTRTLALCGGDLPKSSRFITDIDRETHWEPELIVRIHDEELLEPAGRLWRDLDGPSNACLESDEAFRRRLSAAFHEEFADCALPVFKDPRLCRLLPLWLPIFRELDVTPHALILLRNPLEVAASLRARDRMGIRHGLWLWLRHVLDAERHTRAIPRCFVSYEQLLADWRSVINRAANELGLALRPQSKTAEEELDLFVSKDVSRSRVSMEKLLSRADVPSFVKQAYQSAIQACEGTNASLTELDRISEALTVSDRALTPFRSTYRAWRRYRAK